jgi:hypothetical protein
VNEFHLTIPDMHDAFVCVCVWIDLLPLVSPYYLICAYSICLQTFLLPRETPILQLQHYPTL